MDAKLNRFFLPRSRPLVIGHRGVPLEAQENTLEGIRRALALGLDGVEVDVFLTRDGIPVLFHDEQTERLTGVPGRITEMTWDEVSRLRIRRKVEMGGGNSVTYGRTSRIPLLAEVLDEVKGKLLINIEMKAEFPNWSRRRTGRVIAQTIREAGAEHEVVVTSFDVFMLIYLKREDPGLLSGFAYDDIMAATAARRWAVNLAMDWNIVGAAVGASVVVAEHTLLDQRIVERFHQKGMLVGTYTLFPLDVRAVRAPTQDHAEIALWLARAGVDWIETDDPIRTMMLLQGDRWQRIAASNAEAARR